MKKLICVVLGTGLLIAGMTAKAEVNVMCPSTAVYDKDGLHVTPDSYAPYFKVAAGHYGSFNGATAYSRDDTRTAFCKYDGDGLILTADHFVHEPDITDGRGWILINPSDGEYICNAGYVCRFTYSY